MLVAEAMTASVVTISSEQTLLEALTALRAHRIRHLPVVDGSTLVGIITDRDVKRATPSVFSGDRDEFDRVLASTTVSHVMTRALITVAPETPLRRAVDIFLDRRIGALPVVDGGRLVGILTDIDILRVACDLLPPDEPVVHPSPPRKHPARRKL
jgi:acetoin utilization protein AcuB